jgi:protein-S-isoprenylcysteine O-methyltransferase Ste14
MASPTPTRSVPAWLALRTSAWSLAFVGTFIWYLPWAWFGAWHAPIDPAEPRQLLGLVSIAAGALLVTACIVEFARRGRGTPAPMDAPRQLVVHGPYRYVRNPMYLGAMLVMLGELVREPSRAFAIYIVSWFAAISVLVLAYEEPTLRARFGDSYERYTRHVRRWFPRFGEPYEGG